MSFWAFKLSDNDDAANKAEAEAVAIAEAARCLKCRLPRRRRFLRRMCKIGFKRQLTTAAKSCQSCQSEGKLQSTT